MPHQGPKGDLWGAYAAYVMMVLVNFFVVLSKLKLAQGLRHKGLDIIQKIHTDHHNGPWIAAPSISANHSIQINL